MSRVRDIKKMLRNEAIVTILFLQEDQIQDDIMREQEFKKAIKKKEKGTIEQLDDYSIKLKKHVEEDGNNIQQEYHVDGIWMKEDAIVPSVYNQIKWNVLKEGQHASAFINGWQIMEKEKKIWIMKETLKKILEQYPTETIDLSILTIDEGEGQAIIKDAKTNKQIVTKNNSEGILYNIEEDENSLNKLQWERLSGLEAILNIIEMRLLEKEPMDRVMKIKSTDPTMGTFTWIETKTLCLTKDSFPLSMMNDQRMMRVLSYHARRDATMIFTHCTSLHVDYMEAQQQLQFLMRLKKHKLLSRKKSSDHLTNPYASEIVELLAIQREYELQIQDLQETMMAMQDEHDVDDSHQQQTDEDLMNEYVNLKRNFLMLNKRRKDQAAAAAAEKQQLLDEIERLKGLQSEEEPVVELDNPEEQLTTRDNTFLTQLPTTYASMTTQTEPHHATDISTQTCLDNTTSISTQTLFDTTKEKTISIQTIDDVPHELAKQTSSDSIMSHLSSPKRSEETMETASTQSLSIRELFEDMVDQLVPPPFAETRNCSIQTQSLEELLVDLVENIIPAPKTHAMAIQTEPNEEHLQVQTIPLMHIDSPSPTPTNEPSFDELPSEDDCSTDIDTMNVSIQTQKIDQKDISLQTDEANLKEQGFQTEERQVDQKEQQTEQLQPIDQKEQGLQTDKANLKEQSLQTEERQVDQKEQQTEERQVDQKEQQTEQPQQIDQKEQGLQTDKANLKEQSLQTEERQVDQKEQQTEEPQQVNQKEQQKEQIDQKEQPTDDILHDDEHFEELLNKDDLANPASEALVHRQLRHLEYYYKVLKVKHAKLEEALASQHNEFASLRQLLQETTSSSSSDSLQKENQLLQQTITQLNHNTSKNVLQELLETFHTSLNESEQSLAMWRKRALIAETENKTIQFKIN